MKELRASAGRAGSAGPGSAPVRGTQSFVGTLSACWGRPSLTALEVLWRWVYGAPALWLLFVQGRKVLFDATGGTFELGRLGLDTALLNDPVGALSADPVGAVSKVGGALGLLMPGAVRLAGWGLPLLLVAWVVISAVGRTAVLRRADARLEARVGTLMGLAAIRMAALAGSFGVWFVLMRGAERLAIAAPMRAGEEPNLVLYCALAIVLTLVLFIAWSTVSWWFGVAPLLAMLDGTGVGGSLRAAARLGRVKGKLIEVNLVMGIVKIALMVLAMVFSATPLPFQSVTTPEFLAWWWAGVGVIYLVGSDFFHVARLVAYLTLWRAMDERPEHAS